MQTDVAFAFFLLVGMLRRKTVFSPLAPAEEYTGSGFAGRKKAGGTSRNLGMFCVLPKLHTSAYKEGKKKNRLLRAPDRFTQSLAESTVL